VFSLYPSGKLMDKRNFKKLQFCPESLGAMLEYWYITAYLLRGYIKHSRQCFLYISKDSKIHQKYAALPVTCIFNSFLGFWKCGQTHSFLLDILHKEQFNFKITLLSAWYNTKLCSWVLAATVCSGTIKCCICYKSVISDLHLPYHTYLTSRPVGDIFR